MSDILSFHDLLDEAKHVTPLPSFEERYKCSKCEKNRSGVCPPPCVSADPRWPAMSSVIPTLPLSLFVVQSDTEAQAKATGWHPALGDCDESTRARQVRMWRGEEAWAEADALVGDGDVLVFPMDASDADLAAWKADDAAAPPAAEGEQSRLPPLTMSEWSGRARDVDTWTVDELRSLRRVIVIDSQWQRLSHIFRAMPRLQRLPRMRLRTYHTAFWRFQPDHMDDTFLATIEAIYAFYREYVGRLADDGKYDGSMDNLLAVYAWQRERILDAFVANPPKRSRVPAPLLEAARARAAKRIKTDDA